MTTTAAAETKGAATSTTGRPSIATTSWPTETNRPSDVDPTVRWLKHWSVLLTFLDQLSKIEC
jgi:hypothetical protein